MSRSLELPYSNLNQLCLTLIKRPNQTVDFIQTFICYRLDLSNGLLAAGSSNGWLYLWKLKHTVTLQETKPYVCCVSELEKGSSIINCFFFRYPLQNILSSKYSTFLCSHHNDGILRFWSVDDGRCLHSFSTIFCLASPACFSSLLNDNRFVAMASSRCVVVVDLWLFKPTVFLLFKRTKSKKQNEQLKAGITSFESVLFHLTKNWKNETFMRSRNNSPQKTLQVNSLPEMDQANTISSTLLENSDSTFFTPADTYIVSLTTNNSTAQCFEKQKTRKVQITVKLSNDQVFIWDVTFCLTNWKQRYRCSQYKFTEQQTTSSQTVLNNSNIQGYEFFPEDFVFVAYPIASILPSNQSPKNAKSFSDDNTNSNYSSALDDTFFAKIDRSGTEITMHYHQTFSNSANLQPQLPNKIAEQSSMNTSECEGFGKKKKKKKYDATLCTTNWHAYMYNVELSVPSFKRLTNVGFKTNNKNIFQTDNTSTNSVHGWVPVIKSTAHVQPNDQYMNQSKWVALRCVENVRKSVWKSFMNTLIPEKNNVISNHSTQILEPTETLLAAFTEDGRLFLGHSEEASTPVSKRTTAVWKMILFVVLPQDFIFSKKNMKNPANLQCFDDRTPFPDIVFYTTEEGDSRCCVYGVSQSSLDQIQIITFVLRLTKNGSQFWDFLSWENTIALKSLWENKPNYTENENGNCCVCKTKFENSMTSSTFVTSTANYHENHYFIVSSDSNFRLTSHCVNSFEKLPRFQHKFNKVLQEEFKDNDNEEKRENLKNTTKKKRNFCSGETFNVEEKKKVLCAGENFNLRHYARRRLILKTTKKQYYVFDENQTLEKTSDDKLSINKSNKLYAGHKTYSLSDTEYTVMGKKKNQASKLLKNPADLFLANVPLQNKVTVKLQKSIQTLIKKPKLRRIALTMESKRKPIPKITERSTANVVMSLLSMDHGIIIGGMDSGDLCWWSLPFLQFEGILSGIHISPLISLFHVVHIPLYAHVNRKLSYWILSVDASNQASIINISDWVFLMLKRRSFELKKSKSSHNNLSQIISDCETGSICSSSLELDWWSPFWTPHIEKMRFCMDLHYGNEQERPWFWASRRAIYLQRDVNINFHSIQKVLLEETTESLLILTSLDFINYSLVSNKIIIRLNLSACAMYSYLTPSHINNEKERLKPCEWYWNMASHLNLSVGTESFAKAQEKFKEYESGENTEKKLLSPLYYSSLNLLPRSNFWSLNHSLLTYGGLWLGSLELGKTRVVGVENYSKKRKIRLEKQLGSSKLSSDDVKNENAIKHIFNDFSTYLNTQDEASACMSKLSVLFLPLGALARLCCGLKEPVSEPSSHDTIKNSQIITSSNTKITTVLSKSKILTLIQRLCIGLFLPQNLLCPVLHAVKHATTNNFMTIIEKSIFGLNGCESCKSLDTFNNWIVGILGNCMAISIPTACIKTNTKFTEEVAVHPLSSSYFINQQQIPLCNGLTNNNNQAETNLNRRHQSVTRGKQTEYNYSVNLSSTTESPSYYYACKFESNKLNPSVHTYPPLHPYASIQFVSRCLESSLEDNIFTGKDYDENDREICKTDFFKQFYAPQSTLNVDVSPPRKIFGRVFNTGIRLVTSSDTTQGFNGINKRPSQIVSTFSKKGFLKHNFTNHIPTENARTNDASLEHTVEDDSLKGLLDFSEYSSVSSEITSKIPKKKTTGRTFVLNAEKAQATDAFDTNTSSSTQKEKYYLTPQTLFEAKNRTANLPQKSLFSKKTVLGGRRNVSWMYRHRSRSIPNFDCEELLLQEAGGEDSPTRIKMEDFEEKNDYVDAMTIKEKFMDHRIDESQRHHVIWNDCMLTTNLFAQTDNRGSPITSAYALVLTCLISDLVLIRLLSCLFNCRFVSYKIQEILFQQILMQYHNELALTLPLWAALEFHPLVPVVSEFANTWFTFCSQYASQFHVNQLFRETSYILTVTERLSRFTHVGSRFSAVDVVPYLPNVFYTFGIGQPNSPYFHPDLRAISLLFLAKTLPLRPAAAKGHYYSRLDEPIQLLVARHLLGLVQTPETTTLTVFPSTAPFPSRVIKLFLKVLVLGYSLLWHKALLEMTSMFDWKLWKNELATISAQTDIALEQISLNEKSRQKVAITPFDSTLRAKFDGYDHLNELISTNFNKIELIHTVIFRLYLLMLTKPEYSQLAIDLLLIVGRMDPIRLIRAVEYASKRLDHGAAFVNNAVFILFRFFVKYQWISLSFLPSIVDTIIKCLDPSNPSLRRTTLNSATNALFQLVRVFPMISFHQASQRFALGTTDGFIVIYDLRTASRWRVIDAHSAFIDAVNFNDTGEEIASYCSEELKFSVWQWSFSGFFGGIFGDAGKCLKTLKLSSIAKTSVNSTYQNNSKVRLLCKSKRVWLLRRENGKSQTLRI